MTFGNVQSFHRFLDGLPDEMTVGQLRAHLAAFIKTAECHYCGKPISSGGIDSLWVHEDGSRGCRAASFDPDHDGPGSSWDESIPQSWKATPKP
ncbi:MAG: hypothetical protein ACRDOH_33660 [Streptosporangiaceae bacterium]